MTERKPHPDNDLIDELESEGGASRQGGRAGGQVQRDVGTRAELNNAGGGSDRERPTAQDQSEALNASKGDKTLQKLDPRTSGNAS